MNSADSVLEMLMEPVGQCLTPEVASRIFSLRADSELQSRVDQLADKANAGTLNSDERTQYDVYLRYANFVTLLQLEARKLLSRSSRTN